MAHLWVRNDEDEWAVAPLVGDAFTLLSESPYVERRCPIEGETALMRSTHPGEDEAVWVLLAARMTPLRVNGASVGAGIRALGLQRGQSGSGRSLILRISVLRPS